ISDLRMQPSNLTGNTATGNRMNVFAVSGTVVENWTMPTTGPTLVVINGPDQYGLAVAAGKTVTAPAGVLVKFQTGSYSGLSVAGSL
ncbi:hypothetical protein, partial [Streptomyces brasiliscabiei]|uniref:hypothetical protein n=1 Tax=Streptomyces brasiliscabiei TaxID=2736302 RepID=UPI003015394F